MQRLTGVCRTVSTNPRMPECACFCRKSAPSGFLRYLFEGCPVHWVFSDLAFQDVGFQNASFKTLTHISFRCEVPTPLVVESQSNIIFKPNIPKHHIPELPSQVALAAACTCMRICEPAAPLANGSIILPDRSIYTYCIRVHMLHTYHIYNI